MSALEVRWLNESEYPIWGSFVSSASSGSPYSLPQYLDILTDVTGDRYSILGVYRGNELQGGIAVYEQRSCLGWYVAPRPLLYYNGFVVRDFTTKYPSERVRKTSEIIRSLSIFLSREKYGRISLRNRSPIQDGRQLIDNRWKVGVSYTYAVPLFDLQLQYSLVDQNLRRLIERAIRHEISVSEDLDFETFFALHLALHERKGAPLYLRQAAFRRWFVALHARGLCRLYAARLRDGRVAAMQLVLLGHSVTHTAAAAADPSLLSTGAAPYLRWRVFEELAAEGYEANDLTDATLGSVTHFKEQLGGRLELCLLAERDSYRFRVARRLYRVASPKQSTRR